MSPDALIPNLVTLTLKWIDLNTKAKPRFGAEMTLNNPVNVSLQNQNEFCVTAPQGTPVGVNFQLANSAFTIEAEDLSGNTIPPQIVTTAAKLVGLIIPYNNKSLGASPNAAQFSTVANFNHTDKMLVIDQGTVLYSVPPMTTLVINRNTHATIEHPWRFALYVYYSFSATPVGSGTSQVYSGTAYWDPYVDNEKNN